MDEHLVVFVDFDDAAVATLGDHGQAIVETLKGVNFDLAVIPILGPRLVLPDDLFHRRHLDDGRRPGVQQQVAIGEKGYVVGTERTRDLPFDLALGIDDRHAAPVLAEATVGGVYRQRLLGGKGVAPKAQTENRGGHDNEAVLHADLLDRL